MFDAISKHLTVRNVLIGTATVAAVGGLIYWATRDDNSVADAADVLQSAGESLVGAGSDLITQAATATAEAAEKVADAA